MVSGSVFIGCCIGALISISITDSIGYLKTIQIGLGI